MIEPAGTERRRWLMVECEGCGQLIPIPADWGVTAYLCLACRARQREGRLG